MTANASIASTLLFFQRAKPEPTEKDFNTQLGVHFEEILEMMDTIEIKVTKEDPTAQATSDQIMGLFRAVLKDISINLKNGNFIAEVTDRVEFFDSLLDQIVTATGTGYMIDLDMEAGLEEVNASNLSKFDDNGYPILDENRKIIKGPNYFKADLAKLA